MPLHYNKLPVPYPFNDHYYIPTYLHDSLEDGIWIQFFKEDLTKPALVWNVKNGKQEGFEYFITLSGLIERVNYYEAGVLIGGVHYYDNGVKRDSMRYSIDYEGQYLISWYPNGKLKCKSTYNLQEFWYESGQKRMEKSFNKMVQLDGEMTYWNENASVRYKGTWANGIPLQFYRRKKNGKFQEVDFNRLSKSEKHQIMYNSLIKDLNY